MVSKNLKTSKIELFAKIVDVFNEKYKALEFDNHLRHSINILQVCFESTVYVALSISEPGLEF